MTSARRIRGSMKGKIRPLIAQIFVAISMLFFVIGAANCEAALLKVNNSIVPQAQL
jgi:hypothetical protein